jgi:AcrR family transcriptional regulator
LPDRSNAQEDKRRLLLDAAMRDFVRKEYHASRVGDIAEEAGAAHGLLYRCSTKKVKRAERTLVEIVSGGLAPDLAAATA